MGKLLRLAQGIIDGTLSAKEKEGALLNERVMRQVKSIKENADKPKITVKRKAGKNG